MGVAIDIFSELNTNTKGQKFALDTNVLYWMFYDKCTYSNEIRQKKYQGAVVKLKLKNEIFVSPLCLYELFNIIEKNEYRIYCVLKGLSEKDFLLKDFRELKNERRKLRETLELVNKQVVMFAKVPDHIISKHNVKDTVETYENHQMDIFDKELTRFCMANGIRNIVTDDRDYKSVADEINIYTANRKYFS